MYPHLLKAGFVLWLVSALVACSGGTGQKDGQDGFTITGSVGDASLIGAAVTVTDANGDTVATTVSDEAAGYQAVIPPDTPMPLMIAATGGADLVTGGEPEFDLTAVAFSNSRTVNVSPLSTLITRIADCSDAVTESSISRAWSLIQSEMSMGLTASLNPMNQSINTGNAARIVLANEALREALRRSESALAAGGQNVSADDVLTRIACDLEMDGVLNGVGTNADARTAATFRAAQAAVLLEVIAGGLHIAGQDVSTFLDQAIATVLGASDVSVRDLVINDALVIQAQIALSLFLEAFADDELLDLALLLDGASNAAVAADIEAALDAAHQTVLWDIPERVALVDSSEISTLTARMDEQSTAIVPMISLSASETTVTNGQSVVLTWASGDADRCYASDGWAGEVNLNGSFSTGGLTRSTGYVLECVGLGGSAAAAVQVVVSNPDAAPVTTLTAQSQAVDAGGSTTLSWSSVNADQCQASGAWSGSRGTSGSQSTGALNTTQTYTLTCSGSGGSDSDSVTVTVNGPPQPSPTVTLSAAEQLLDSGGSTTLTWSSTNASGCTASGGWSGGKGTGGSESVGPINARTTYTLTCSGAGGNAVAMITVNVNGELSLSWVAPTENVDGSALTDLASYRIYYGSSSRSYSNSEPVNDANATSFAVTVPSGSYYVAMTAVDADGNESAYSNEVLKATN